jgi:hypothetical protein
LQELFCQATQTLSSQRAPQIPCCALSTSTVRKWFSKTHLQSQVQLVYWWESTFSPTTL